MLDGRRDHDDRDNRPSRHGANGPQKIPAVHHRHAQIEQDETGQLGLALEPVNRSRPLAGPVSGVAFPSDDFGNGPLFRGKVIVNRLST